MLYGVMVNFWLVAFAKMLKPWMIEFVLSSGEIDGSSPLSDEDNGQWSSCFDAEESDGTS
jgi:hypothetical protein